MELHQISYFLKVGQLLNFTRAADELHVSQPALSRQIKALEDELNVLLLERLPTGVRLTPAGQALMAHLQAISQQLEQTPRLLEPYARGLKGTLTVGCPPSLAAQFLPAVVSTFTRRFPEMDLVVQVIPTSDDVVRQLQDGSLDAGLCSQREQALEQTLLFEEPLAAALPEAFPAGHGEAVSLAELAGQPYIATPPSCTVQRLIGAESSRLLHKVLEVDQLETALHYVAAGLGFAIVPASLASSPRSGVRFLPLRPQRLHPVFAAWRRGGALHQAHPFVATLLECSAQQNERPPG